MSKLVVKSELLAELSALQGETWVVNEKGKPLGKFTPIDPAKLEPRVSEEELLRSLNSSERRFTTGELLASLGQL